MENKLEIRHLASAELRASGGNKLHGYAAVFNAPSEPIGGQFIETIKPGAFAESLRRRPVTALSSHDPGAVVGSTRNQSLQLVEDDRGLRFSLELPNTTVARDLHELVRTGIVSGMSIGFVTDRDQWPSRNQRELLAVTLYEVSVVAFPAYPQTSVQARSDGRQIQSVGLYRPPSALGGDDALRTHLRLRLRLAELEQEQS